jgi:pimeloyl-ACP methyl ester carboxylesterase
VAAPPPRDLDTKVDVGGYSLHILCAGVGSPTVVFDAGMGSTSSGWARVLPGVQAFTHACAYDRAGLGQSDPGPKPRTSREMAVDLHALLANAGVAGPYVLVAHSSAGFNARLYASLYPREVVGMVLVDCSHPDQNPRFLALLPPESPGDSARLRAFRNDLLMFGKDPSLNPEGMDWDASAAQVRAAGSLGAMPLEVLAHGRSELSDDFPPDLAAKFLQTWHGMQKELAGLSSNSTYIVAAESGHDIQNEQPDLVIDSIRRVVAAARRPSSALRLRRR